MRAAALSSLRCLALRPQESRTEALGFTPPSIGSRWEANTVKDAHARQPRPAGSDEADQSGCGFPHFMSELKAATFRERRFSVPIRQNFRIARPSTMIRTDHVRIFA